MEKIHYLTFVVFFMGCSDQTKDKKENVHTTTNSEVIPNFDIVLRFINDYTEHCRRDMNSHSNTDSNWIEHNLLLTQKFKRTYRNLLDSTSKDDQELGLDFDPIFDAQDFPDRGFAFSNKDTVTEYVSVIGKSWKEFELVLKMTNLDGKWLVDGAGVINIPKNKRAKR